MDRSSVETALYEAQLLAGHVSRGGRLPANSRIFEEIDAVTQAQARGEHPPIAPLIAETQKLCRATHTTLELLLRRDTLAGRISRRAVIATPYLVGLMTLLLTLYLAFQSSELHKADLALREYRDLESERLQEKLYQAYKLFRYERVLNVQGPPLAQLDGYQQLVADAKRLSEKRYAVKQLLVDASVIRYLPEWDAEPPPEPVNATASSPSRSSASAPQATTLPASAGQEQATLPTLTLDCSKETEVPGPGSTNKQASAFGNRVELDDYRRGIDCFVQALQIDMDYDYPMAGVIYSTRNKVNLLVSWMLPGLYGLLGACVFLMRDLLRIKGLNGAGTDARIVDMLSLLLRVALGGLAGIIVGWFWVPSGSGQSTSAIDVSSLSFGVAFLAGFSIDSLFALLDRLIKNFGQSAEEKSAEGSNKVDVKP